MEAIHSLADNKILHKLNDARVGHVHTPNGKLYCVLWAARLQLKVEGLTLLQENITAWTMRLVAGQSMGRL
jgi:archaeosine-15-forming tRNA-guanine transglycosylase